MVSYTMDNGVPLYRRKTGQCMCVCEILHSPLYSVDVESECSYISAQHVCLNDMDKGNAVLLPF